MKPETEPTYPRRLFIRRILRHLSRAALHPLARVEITGRENIPRTGPLLIVANHFSFLDPVLVIHSLPWPVEFLGGFRMPNAPSFVTWIPKLWGYYPLFRGTGAIRSLRIAETILRQRGIIGIFPEGGNWATVLRPARPGTAFLAIRTQARLLPIGLSGLVNLLPRWRPGKRGHVLVKIGKPFGPYTTQAHGRDRRRRLDEIGHEIMRHIAALLPPERRGHYSEDPAIRAAAQGTEIYPWEHLTETEL